MAFLEYLNIDLVTQIIIRRTIKYRIYDAWAMVRPRPFWPHSLMRVNGARRP